MLRTTPSQGTIVTPRLHLARPLHDQRELGPPSQGKGYMVLPDAVPIGDVPRPHMVHVQTDRCLCPASPVEVAVLALGNQQAEWRASAEKRCAAGTEEVWLGEGGKWARVELWLEHYIAARLA